MIFLEIFYNLWLIGTMLLTVNLLSLIYFDNHLPARTGRYFFATLFFVLIWPLAIFSPGGRKILAGRIHQL